MATVLIKNTLGRQDMSFSLPNGKKVVIDFKPVEEGGDCLAEVPVEVDYKDDFKNTHRFHENYASFLLKSYPHLEVVKVNKDTVLEKKTVEEPRKKGKQT